MSGAQIAGAVIVSYIVGTCIGFLTGYSWHTQTIRDLRSELAHMKTRWVAACDLTSRCLALLRLGDVLEDMKECPVCGERKLNINRVDVVISDDNLFRASCACWDRWTVAATPCGAAQRWDDDIEGPAPRAAQIETPNSETYHPRAIDE